MGFGVWGVSSKQSWVKRVFGKDLGDVMCSLIGTGRKGSARRL